MLIQTQRLLLRPWQSSDAPHLLPLIEANRERFTRSFPKTLAAVRDEASATVFIAEKTAAWTARTSFQLSIWLSGSPNCAGFISLLNLDWSVPRAELAYLLAPEFEGQGMMAEALAAALRWAFAELNLERVSCRIWPGNTRSIRLAERLGFQYEGQLRHDFRDGYGQLTDTNLYGLLPSDVAPLPNPA
jgi:RimJ/RimL family protein N-acetyltransferase